MEFFSSGVVQLEWRYASMSGSLREMLLRVSNSVKSFLLECCLNNCGSRGGGSGLGTLERKEEERTVRVAAVLITSVMKEKSGCVSGKESGR